MNKKHFLGMFAAATMLFATSCSNDELNTVQSGNEATVSFTLDVDGGVKSRAISDGTGADRLIYAIFDAEGNRIASIDKVDKETQFPIQENITLAKGETYKVAFWAQDNDCDAYTVSDDMKVSINYEGNNNDETRDAFFATREFTVTGQTHIDVTLERPFAQINVGVTDEDWNAAVASGVEIESSKVVIKKAATSINLLDGSVSGEADVTYDYAEIPRKSNESLSMVDTDETFNYLSMSYILVNDVNGGAGKATLEDVDFIFRSTDGKDYLFAQGLNNVPVQRNWRTNIIGQLLTGNVHFNIKVDPIYNGESDIDENGNVIVYGVRLGDKLYATIEKALANAVDGDVINLGEGEFALPQNITLKNRAAEGSLTFVGEGEKTIVKGNQVAASGINVKMQNLTYETPNSGYNSGFAHAKSVSFEDCKIIGQYYAQSSAPHTFANCTIDPLTGYLYTYGANCTFDGCTFNSSEGKALQVYAEAEPGVESTVTINNCTFTAAKTATTFDGKPVTAIDINSIRGNKFNVNITNTTATGYATGLFSGSDLWNIKGGEDNVVVTIDGETVYPTISINGVYYSTLEAALAAAVDNDVINILSGTFEVPAGGKGKTLTFVGSDPAKVTFKLRPNGDAHHDGAFADSKITFENLTLEADPNLPQYSGYGHCEGTYKNCTITVPLKSQIVF